MAKDPSIAMLALGNMKKGDEENPDSMPAEDEGLVTAMEDFMSAFAAKDPQGMAAAFRSACEMCESGGSYGEDQ